MYMNGWAMDQLSTFSPTAAMNSMNGNHSNNNPMAALQSPLAHSLTGRSADVSAPTYGQSYPQFMYSPRSSEAPRTSSTSLPLITPYPPPPSFASPSFAAAGLAYPTAAVSTGGTSVGNGTSGLATSMSSHTQLPSSPAPLWHPQSVQV